MNSMQLKDKLKNISKEKNVDFNTLLRIHMYDRFIERLAVSNYKDNFILKGGFYLSTLFGVENRTTMDIDTAFKNANFDEETIVKMIKEIVSIEIDDNVKLSYLGISPIRDQDEYGGFRIGILVEFENIKEKFHLDIATGDPITPKEIKYSYKPILGESYIKLWAYNIETVLSEKIETILNRLELNGRMRDYYDIYLIYKKDWKNINIEYFRKAIENTFSKREYTRDVYDDLNKIKTSISLKRRWDIYKNKYDYAKDIAFENILICLEEIISVLILETV